MTLVYSILKTLLCIALALCLARLFRLAADPDEDNKSRRKHL